MFGGNSNWRGPVWFPLNYLAIRPSGSTSAFLGDDFTVEYPTGSGDAAHLRLDRPGPRRPAHLHLAARPRRPPARSTATTEAPADRPRLEGQPALLRVLPRRQRRGSRRHAPDRLDSARRRPASSTRRQSKGDDDGREGIRERDWRRTVARGCPGDLRHHRRPGAGDDLPVPVPARAARAAVVPDRRRRVRRLDARPAGRARPRVDRRHRRATRPGGLRAACGPALVRAGRFRRRPRPTRASAQAIGDAADAGLLPRDPAVPLRDRRGGLARRPG